MLYKLLHSSPCRDTKQNKDEDMISLDYSPLCYIASKIGWVSIKGIYK